MLTADVSFTAIQARHLEGFQCGDLNGTTPTLEPPTSTPIPPTPTISPEVESICGDGLDNDEDGNVDWDDSDCKIVINEVYYDESGTDGPNVFIELFGPKNTPLNGLRVVGMNGGGGADYATINLTGSTDSNGYYLLATSNYTNPSIVDQTNNSADLQNGPDAVRIDRGNSATTLDLLGYGVPLPLNFYETLPTADVDAGYSLSRNPSHADTNNNNVDFRSCIPSPKSEDASCWL